MAGSSAESLLILWIHTTADSDYPTIGFDIWQCHLNENNRTGSSSQCHQLRWPRICWQQTGKRAFNRDGLPSPVWSPSVIFTTFRQGKLSGQPDRLAILFLPNFRPWESSVLPGRVRPACGKQTAQSIFPFYFQILLFYRTVSDTTERDLSGNLVGLCSSM